MRPRDKMELLALIIAVGAAGLVGDRLPRVVGAGPLLTTLCLLWLVQGGVRDAFIWWEMKRHPDPSPPRRLACMCFESTVGLIALVIGIIFALLDRGGHVQLSGPRWTGLIAAMLALGFLVKDLVITWRPLGIRRDHNHHGIIFSWR